MLKIKEYNMIAASSAEELTEFVNQNIVLGYQPFGSPMVLDASTPAAYSHSCTECECREKGTSAEDDRFENFEYLQAMVKYE